MVLTLCEGNLLNMKVNINTFPRKLLYNNEEYFLGNEVGRYCGIKHGGIYSIPEIRLNRILLTNLGSRELHACREIKHT